MSTTDPRPPDPDTNSWADAIANAAAHVRLEASRPSETEEHPRRPTQGRHVAAGLLVAAVVALGVHQVVVAGASSLPPAEQAADLRVEASSLVEQIEAHRSARGELPDPSLFEHYLEEGYDYDVLDAQGGRYVVRRTAGGVTVTYDGSLPLEFWLQAGGGGSSGGAP